MDIARPDRLRDRDDGPAGFCGPEPGGTGLTGQRRLHVGFALAPGGVRLGEIGLRAGLQQGAVGEPEPAGTTAGSNCIGP